MNIKLRRFLILNTILNGHDVLEACDGEMSIFCEAFNVSEFEGKKLLEKISTLQKDGFEPSKEYYPEVMALLNFYRSYNYALFIPEGDTVDPISVRALSNMSEAEGLTDAAAHTIISSLIRVIAPVAKPKDVRVADGVFYMSSECLDKFKADGSFLSDLYMTAFSLLRSGPREGIEAAELIKKRANIETYKDISANMLYKIVNKMIEVGMKPAEYRKTCLDIPDLLPVYKYCGAILCNNVDSPDTLYWLIETGENFEACKVILADAHTVYQLVADSPMNLSKIGFVVGANDNGLVRKDSVA